MQEPRSFGALLFSELRSDNTAELVATELLDQGCPGLGGVGIWQGPGEALPAVEAGECHDEFAKPVRL